MSGVNTVNADSVLECIARGENRQEVMRTLRGGPTELRELSDSIGMPRTTLRHSIEQLTDHGLVKEVHAGKYRLTNLGAAVLDGLTAYENHVATAIELESFLNSVPTDELGFDVCGITEATLTEATREFPYAPSRELTEALETAREVVGFTPVVPAVSQRPFERLVRDDEVTLTLVVTRPVANAIETEFDTAMLGGTTDIFVTGTTISVGGFVVDETAYVQGFDDRGKPHVLLGTDATGVREWVRDRIDELRGSAGPLTAAELEGDVEAD